MQGNMKKKRPEQKDPSKQRTKTIKLHNYRKQDLQFRKKQKKNGNKG